MAYTHSSSLGCWDLHNLGFLNADISSSRTCIMMDSNNAASLMLPSADTCSSFLSTGYLEDALFEFSVRFKRRKLMVCQDEYYDPRSYDPFPTHFTDDLSYWSNWFANYNMHSLEELNYASLLPHDMLYSAGECMEKSMTEMCEEIMNFPEANSTLLLDEVVSSAHNNNNNNNNNNLKVQEVSNSKEKYDDSIMKTKSNNAVAYSSDTYSTDSSSVSEEREMKKKQRMNSSSSSTTKMVYPFGLVKPGGEDGDITLHDINRRIMMPPTRPLKHPVGDYACRPAVSPHGPGLSGKAVVALTRIHTQGRGTITIIRTKG